jgi:hypothetical protein
VQTSPPQESLARKIPGSAAVNSFMRKERVMKEMMKVRNYSCGLQSRNLVVMGCTVAVLMCLPAVAQDIQDNSKSNNAPQLLAQASAPAAPVKVAPEPIKLPIAKMPVTVSPALREAWEKTIHHTPAPRGGCFTAAYPSTKWVEVECAPPPKPHNVRPQRIIKKEGGTEAVGGTASGSNDLVAQSPSGHFFTNVAGKFRVVDGVTSETNVQVPAYPYTGISGSNEFMLQINTNSYTYSSACGSYSSCYPWVQYLMSTNDIVSSTDTGKSVVFIEYWLFNYGGAGHSSGTCPTGFSDIEPDTEGYDCEQNGSATVIYDGQIPITDLDQLSMSAGATAGGNDEATVTYKGVAYKATVPDSYTNISSIWNQAEFNVLGNWNGWQAQFNDGTVLILESDVTDGTATAPTCQFNAGTTGESNNLNFVPSTASPVCCPFGGTDPSIQFMEVYDTAHTHTASCGSSSITGAPHITTVNGTYYNFQAAGEFVALQDADGTEIQTRQTPIPTLAPGNYDPGNLDNDGLVSCLAMNTAVAAKVGTHRVTYEPEFSGAYASGPFQLRIDGKLTTLGAGGVNLAGGGQVKDSSAGGGIEVDFPDGQIMTAIPAGSYDSMNLLNVSTENLGLVSGAAGATAKGLSGTVPSGSWLPALPNGKSVGAMPASLHDRYVTLYSTFGNAWRVTKSNSLFDYAPGTSTATYTNSKWPVENAKTCTIPNQKAVAPVSETVAEDACKSVTSKTLHASCVFDVQVTGNTGFADTYLLTERVHTAFKIEPIDLGKLVSNVK